MRQRDAPHTDEESAREHRAHLVPADNIIQLPPSTNRPTTQRQTVAKRKDYLTNP